MKEKNIEKIIGKLAAFGKVKIENDGKGKYLHRKCMWKRLNAICFMSAI